MSNDLIRRDVLNDILDIYEKYHPRLATNVYAFGVALRELIENTPTVDFSKEVWNKSNELLNKRLSYLERPTSEWIPVSERLPDKANDYLITYISYGEALVGKSWFNEHQGFIYDNVIAWQPLPKPYEGSEEE